MPPSTPTIRRAVVICMILASTVLGSAAADPITSPTVLVDGALGSDKTGCGDSAMPCKSIGYALSEYGDRNPTIAIRPGLYAEELVITKSAALIGNYADDAPLPRRTQITQISGSGSGTPITIKGGQVSLTELIITDGSAETGGGLDIRDAEVSISSCSITSNDGGDGGGLYVANAGTVVEITASEISGNTAQEDGGAIYCDGASLTLQECTLADNEAIYGSGGAIAVSSEGYVEASCCIITGNQVKASGGAVATSDTASIVLDNCLLTDNRANLGYGNVLYNGGADPLVYSCTIVGNNPERSSAVYLAENRLRTINTIWRENGDNFQATVVWDELWDLAHCNVEGGWTGTGNIDADPRFAGGGDYHLTEDSPCVDAGMNMPFLDRDLEGTSRPQDGDGDGIALLDIGCYETPSLYRVHLSLIE